MTKLSQAITDAIRQIEIIALKTSKAKIIMAGGDDIFLVVEQENYQQDLVRRLGEKFLEICGCTMSFGIGNTVEDAYLNLRRSKSSKNFKNLERKNG